jgi:hypothetical protein
MRIVTFRVGSKTGFLTGGSLFGCPLWSFDPCEARGIDDEDLPEALATLVECLDPEYVRLDRLELNFADA